MATYYIKNDGNDSNSGLSDALAWRTADKVNDYSTSPGFQPGDNILFKCGETITSTDFYLLEIKNSGTAGNPITIGSYGTGDKPILNGIREVIPGSSVLGNWTNTSGNIWTLSLSGSGRQRIWLNDVEVKQNYYTTVTSTEPWKWDANIFYLYSVGNPASTYTSIKRVPPRYGIYLIGVSYITISGLDIRTVVSGIEIATANNIIIDNCDIGYDIEVYGIKIRPATSYVEIFNCTLDTNDHLFDTQFNASNSEDGILIQHDVHHINIHDNTFINWGHTAFCVYDDDIAQAIYNITVHHNYFYWDGTTDYGRAIGFDIEEAITGSINNEIYCNLIVGQRVNSQIQAPYLKVYYNIWYDSHSISYTETPRYSAGHAVSFVAYNGIPQYMEFYNNVFAESDGYGILIQGTSPPPYIGYNIINNNIFYKNKGFHWADLYEHKGYEYYQLFITDHTGSLENTFKNNIFYYPGVDDLIYYGRDTVDDYPHTVAEFNAENGNDGDIISNNIQGDPLFVIPTSDFHIQLGSPCINAGIDVGLSTDYDGVAISGLPDIGAYEYVDEQLIEISQMSKISII